MEVQKSFFPQHITAKLCLWVIIGPAGLIPIAHLDYFFVSSSPWFPVKKNNNKVDCDTRFFFLWLKFKHISLQCCIIFLCPQNAALFSFLISVQSTCLDTDCSDLLTSLLHTHSSVTIVFVAVNILEPSWKSQYLPFTNNLHKIWKINSLFSLQIIWSKMAQIRNNFTYVSNSRIGTLSTLSGSYVQLVPNHDQYSFFFFSTNIVKGSRIKGDDTMPALVGCVTWANPRIFLSLRSLTHKTGLRASLVAQWLRIRLSMQGTRVRALVREDPTCRGATKPVRHNYWACTLEPASHYWSPRATTTEALVPRARALPQEKPQQWEALAP